MSNEKVIGAFLDLFANLAAVFRYVLPGVLVMGAAYLAYPEWFKRLDLRSNQHLIVLAVITVTVGNTWFALNRYGLHQLVDLVLYLTKSNGPARRDKCHYLNDLGRYTYRSLHVADASAKAQEHVRFRASTLLLILTLGEVAILATFFHSSNSVFVGHGYRMFSIGATILAIGVWQMVITRRIDFYVVNPPSSSD